MDILSIDAFQLKALKHKGQKKSIEGNAATIVSICMQAWHCHLRNVPKMDEITGTRIVKEVKRSDGP